MHWLKNIIITIGGKPSSTSGILWVYLWEEVYGLENYTLFEFLIRETKFKTRNSATKFTQFKFKFVQPILRAEDWAFREAYLQIARREKSGEPLVSPDYVPIDKIKLPSDEEIGDMEIII